LNNHRIINQPINESPPPNDAPNNQNPIADLQCPFIPCPHRGGFSGGVSLIRHINRDHKHEDPVVIQSHGFSICRVPNCGVICRGNRGMSSHMNSQHPNQPRPGRNDAPPQVNPPLVNGRHAFAASQYSAEYLTSLSDEVPDDRLLALSSTELLFLHELWLPLVHSILLTLLSLINSVDTTVVYEASLALFVLPGLLARKSKDFQNAALEEMQGQQNLPAAPRLPRSSVIEFLRCIARSPSSELPSDILVFARRLVRSFPQGAL